jgi:hypothetical protein
MTDVPPGNSGSAQVVPPGTEPLHPPFPIVRLLYAVGFAFVAWFVFYILLAIGAIQFAVLAITGRLNDDLKNFSLGLVQYLWEILAFVTFIRDEQPFPFGPFPKHDAAI